jgi:hypothetical protein
VFSDYSKNEIFNIDFVKTDSSLKKIVLQCSDEYKRRNWGLFGPLYKIIFEKKKELKQKNL